MTDQTHPHDSQDRINAILRDRSTLRAILPQVLAKAEATYPPNLQQRINQHRITVEEARFYAAGMGPTTIARLRGKSKQSVDQAIRHLVRAYLGAFPELLDDKAA